jgi:hypothetical protein
MSSRPAKRPHELTLEVLKVNTPVTPVAIDKHVGIDGYSSKHIWFLRKLGFVIDATKDGRTVTSYTLVSEPATAEEIRAGKPKKAKAEKTEKVAAKKAAPKKTAEKKVSPKVSPKKVSPKSKTEKSVKSKNLKTIKKVAKARKDLEDMIKAEPVATSYAIDPDWDSTDNIKVADLI